MKVQGFKVVVFLAVVVAVLGLAGAQYPGLMGYYGQQRLAPLVLRAPGTMHQKTCDYDDCVTDCQEKGAAGGYCKLKAGILECQCCNDSGEEFTLECGNALCHFACVGKGFDGGYCNDKLCRCCRAKRNV